MFVQFCGHDPETLFRAAKLVEDRCDAVDLNLGCPQGIARRGHYGSFLLDDVELLERIVRRLSTGSASCDVRSGPVDGRVDARGRHGRALPPPAGRRLLPALRPRRPRRASSSSPESGLAIANPALHPVLLMVASAACRRGALFGRRASTAMSSEAAREPALFHGWADLRVTGAFEPGRKRRRRQPPAQREGARSRRAAKRRRASSAPRRPDPFRGDGHRR